MQVLLLSLIICNDQPKLYNRIHNIFGEVIVLELLNPESKSNSLVDTDPGALNSRIDIYFNTVLQIVCHYLIYHSKFCVNRYL